MTSIGNSFSNPFANAKPQWSLFRAGYLAVVLGALLLVIGITGETLSNFMLGVSMIAVGVPLILLHTRRLAQRVAYSIAGVSIVALWIIPWDFEAFGLLKRNPAWIRSSEKST